MSFFEAISLTKRFVGLTALEGISLQQDQGEIVGIVGPNGSGKTTFFNCVMGVHQPEEGKILFQGKNVVGMKPHEICHLGISRTFQITQLFSDMTVLQNMLIAQEHRKEKILRCMFQRSNKLAKEKALYFLEFSGLIHLRNVLAGELSYGDQKLLEIAMSLMSDAKLILLDEPTAGINPAVIDRIIDHILKVNKTGISFQLIEHNMSIIYQVSKRIYVFSDGKNLAEGSPEDIRNNDSVREVFM